MHHNGKKDNKMPDQSNNNTKSQERILKNTSYLTLAFILQKVLSFLYFIYIARYLGPVDLGLYDPIKSLIPILLILIDFSLSVVLVREIARKPENTESYLSTVLGIKFITAFIIILSMGLYTNFSGNSAVIKMILYIDAIIVALDTFTITFFAVFRGLQNMKFEAIGVIGTQVITIIFGVLSIVLGWGLQALFIAVLTGSIFNFIFSYLMLRRKLKIRISFRWDKYLVKRFLKIAVPFAIAAIFVKIYTFTDRYMLLFIAGQSYVGWYVTAHKLTYALEFIPSAFGVSIFPALSEYYINSKEKLARTFEKAMHYLMILSVPISIGIFILAEKIVVSLYGEVFSASVLPLRILIVGLIVIFLNFPVGAFLNACNKQVINTRNMGITVFINIILNIYLIKEYTFNGAAVAALVSGIVLFILGLRWVGKVIKYDKKFLIKSFGKTIFSGIIMGIVLFLMVENVDISLSFSASNVLNNVAKLTSIGIYVLVGAMVYFLTLFSIGGITKNEVQLLYRRFIKKDNI